MLQRVGGVRATIPEDLQVVGVSTAVAPDAPNYPPGEWLADMGWTWPVIADDDELTAADAYGVTGFPYIVFIDADGNVTATRLRRAADRRAAGARRRRRAPDA